MFSLFCLALSPSPPSIAVKACPLFNCHYLCPSLKRSTPRNSCKAAQETHVNYFPNIPSKRVDEILNFICLNSKTSQIFSLLHLKKIIATTPMLHQKLTCHSVNSTVLEHQVKLKEEITPNNQHPIFTQTKTGSADCYLKIK